MATLAQIPHGCDDRSTRSADYFDSKRLVGVDVARGVALLGMMVVHLLPPATEGGDPSAIWLASVGKASALFAVVAGVGIAFTTGRQTGLPPGRWPSAAASLLARAALIGVLGMALGVVVSVDTANIILPYYALLFLLAIPLLRLPIRWLLGLAVLTATALPVLSHLFRSRLGPQRLANPTFADLANPANLGVELALTGAYPALAWLTYLLVGLAIGRSRLSRAVVVGMMVVGLVMVGVARLTSWYLIEVAGGRAALLEARGPRRRTTRELLVYGGDGVTPATDPWWLATAAPHTATPLDLLLTTGMAVAVLGACIALGWVLPRLLPPLAAAGSMPLTLYSAHLLLLVVPGLPGGGTGFVLQALLLITGAMLWRRRFDRGPLEQVVWWVARHVARLVPTQQPAQVGR
jgi:uncharacterized membrane protein